MPRAALLAHIATHYVRRDRLSLADARAAYTTHTGFADDGNEVAVSPAEGDS